ncbi:40S ribosomal protein S6-like [Cricetulus griseus]|uniref:40S ribosomal protein S6-like n=1 Tax=Cricetulus griseus TaxID=10029 RepID=UPI00022F5C16|nr:40S ribosomal protein S6-like [Cricetulus griseus]
MKLNKSFPVTGCQKLIKVDNERKLRTFYEKHMATEVSIASLSEEWKGYVVQISSGNDKQGFPMKQGVLTHGRVCLLLSKGHSFYRPRRTGERKRKSVRGCIVDANLSVLNLVIVKKKKGEKDIPGLTDTTVPRRLGPKRASRTQKLFNLSKEDDVRQYVVRKPLNKEDKKPRTKAPKIQHLVTPHVLQHKWRIALKKQGTKKNKEEASSQRCRDGKLLAKRVKEAKEKRQEQIDKRCRLSSLRASTSKSESRKQNKSLRDSGVWPSIVLGGFIRKCLCALSQNNSGFRMAKATKKSQDPSTDIKPTTSSAKSKKAKIRREPKAGICSKVDGASTSRNSGKVQKTYKKDKKTPPRNTKRKASENIKLPTKKTKRANEKALFGHYHRLMEEMTSTETEPDQSSIGSSSASMSDLESQ